MPATIDAVTISGGTVTATTFTGALSGSLVGPMTGNGNGTWTGPLIGNVTGGIVLPGVQLSASGAISIPATSTDYYITLGSAAALTIAAPTAITDDFKRLTVWTETAFAHVITCATDGFNAKGASGTLTWAATKGNAVVFEARNGHWWVISVNGVTVA